MRYLIFILLQFSFSIAKAQDDYVTVPLDVALQNTNFKKIVDHFDHTVWTLERYCIGDSCYSGNDSSFFIIARWIPMRKADSVFLVGYCDSLFYVSDPDSNNYTLGSYAHKPGIVFRQERTISPLTFTVWYGTDQEQECLFSILAKDKFSLTSPISESPLRVNYYKPAKPNENAMHTINYSFEHLMK